MGKNLKSRQKGGIKRSWSSDLWVWWTEAAKPRRWCANPCQTGSSTWSQASPFGAAGDRCQGVRLHLRDAEFLPLRSKRDSLFSCCSTKTRGEETRSSVIIRGRLQTIFSTQWELGAVKTAQRSRAYKSQLFGQECDADLWGAGGGGINFTLQRGARRENIHSDGTRKCYWKVKKQNIVSFISVKTNEGFSFHAALLLKRSSYWWSIQIKL